MLLVGGRTNTLAEFRELARQAGLEVVATESGLSHFLVECRPRRPDDCATGARRGATEVPRPWGGPVLEVGAVKMPGGLERERRSQRGGLGVVAVLAVLDLPRHERGAPLGEVEDLTVQRLPFGGAVRLFDRRECRGLRRAISVEMGEPVHVPPVCGALDPKR